MNTNSFLAGAIYERALQNNYADSMHLAAVAEEAGWSPWQVWLVSYTLLFGILIATFCAQNNQFAKVHNVPIEGSCSDLVIKGHAVYCLDPSTKHFRFLFPFTPLKK